MTNERRKKLKRAARNVAGVGIGSATGTGAGFLVRHALRQAAVKELNTGVRGVSRLLPLVGGVGGGALGLLIALAQNRKAAALAKPLNKESHMDAQLLAKIAAAATHPALDDLREKLAPPKPRETSGDALAPIRSAGAFVAKKVDAAKEARRAERAAGEARRRQEDGAVFAARLRGIEESARKQRARGKTEPVDMAVPKKEIGSAQRRIATMIERARAGRAFFPTPDKGLAPAMRRLREATDAHSSRAVYAPTTPVKTRGLPWKPPSDRGVSGFGRFPGADPPVKPSLR